MRDIRLRVLRQNAGWTQRQIAELLGCTQNLYSKSERGERNMSFRRWVKPADFYGVSMDCLVGRSDRK